MIMPTAICGGSLATLLEATAVGAAGAAVCIIIYLFLLNFPGLGQRSATAGIAPVLAIAAGTWWLNLRFLRADGMSLSELGLGANDRRLARLGIGFLAGSVLTLVWIAIVTLTTGATWHPNPAFRAITLIGAYAFAFFNNIGEELVYRGYAFVRLADRFGPYVTAVATSALFALLHLQAGIPWLSVLTGVFSSGLIFAAIFCAVAERAARSRVPCRHQRCAGCFRVAHERGIPVRSRVSSNRD
jgi:membrane protease YdiL (CAAX protease family)